MKLQNLEKANQLAKEIESTQTLRREIFLFLSKRERDDGNISASFKDGKNDIYIPLKYDYQHASYLQNFCHFLDRELIELNKQIELL